MILQGTGQSEREQLQAINGCLAWGIPWRFSRYPCNSKECHVGTVEWCQQAMGWEPVPDYYPEWLREWRHRYFIQTDRECVSEIDWFVKPEWGYKVGPTRIVRAGEMIPARHWISEVVKFTQEWRYYVADGELLAAGWYDGTDEAEPAPVLNIDWPTGWCGAADFGRLDDGRIAVVEVHHPYACGNYLEAEECEAWVMWLELGWQWTMKQKDVLR
jgi:hypothetical protein